MKLKGFMIVMGGNLARLMITLERICPFIDCIDLKTCTHFIHETELLVKEWGIQTIADAATNNFLGRKCGGACIYANTSYNLPIRVALS